MEFDPMAVLGTKRTVQCFNCGDKVPAAQSTCPRCKAELPAEGEDEAQEESLNVVSGPPLPTGDVLTDAIAATGGYGAPRKRNIDKLEEAFKGVSDGTLIVDAYRARIGDVYKMMNAAVQLSKTDVMQERIKGLDEETAVLYRQAGPLLEEYLRGIVKMREYPNTLNLDDAEEGLNIAKAAVEKIEVVRDAANALGDRIEAEKKAKALAEGKTEGSE